MKIGIIGAGQIGGTLTRRLTALGHKVFVANSRGPETLSDLAAETGATAVSVAEAVRGVGLVVVTIPQKNIPNLPAGLFAGCVGRGGRSRYRQLLPTPTRRPHRGDRGGLAREPVGRAAAWPTGDQSVQ
jgi:6-phosphogluconate dehydrogenase (decarboxylating)